MAAPGMQKQKLSMKEREKARLRARANASRAALEADRNAGKIDLSSPVLGIKKTNQTAFGTTLPGKTSTNINVRKSAQQLALEAFDKNQPSIVQPAEIDAGSKGLLGTLGAAITPGPEMYLRGQGLSAAEARRVMQDTKVTDELRQELSRLQGTVIDQEGRLRTSTEQFSLAGKALKGQIEELGKLTKAERDSRLGELLDIDGQKTSLQTKLDDVLKSEELKKFDEKQAEALRRQEVLFGKQAAIEQQQQARLERQTAAQQAGARNVFAQGREGTFGTGAPRALSTFIAETDDRILEAQRRVGLAQTQRDFKIAQLNEAIKEGREDLIFKLKEEARQSEKELLQAEKDLIAEQRQARTEQRLNTKTTLEIFDSMGSAISDLSVAQLNSMISGTSLDLPTAVAIQKAVGLEAEAEKTKDEAEAAKKRLEAQKLKAEITQIGLTPDAKDIEFFNQLKQSGAFTSKDAEIAVARKLGIELPEDPLTKANERKSLAEARIKEIEAAGKPIPGSKEDFELRKLKLEVEEMEGDIDRFGGFSNVGSFGADVPAARKWVDSPFGRSQVTAYGSPKWSMGLDLFLEGRQSAPVPVPFEYEVIDLVPTAESGGFGNQARVRNTADGQELWISHLNNFGNVQIGQTYSAGTSVGMQGNTGDVIPLAGGDGTHLDLTMPKVSNASTANPGDFHTPQEVASYLAVGQEVSPGIPKQMQAQIDAFAFRLGASQDERKKNLKNIKAEISSGRAKTPAEAKVNLGIVTKDDREVISDMRKEIVNPARENFNEIENKLRSLPLLSDLETGIGDVGIVVNFLKVLDPRSVARESEVASVEEARGILSNVGAAWNKLATGEKLTDEQREQILGAADILAGAAADDLYKKIWGVQNDLKEQGIPVNITIQSELDRLEKRLGGSRAAQIRAEVEGVEPFDAVRALEEARSDREVGFGQEENAEIDDIFAN